jgi:HPt (histidine-containing phosphotransfer) domain-containing protein
MLDSSQRFAVLRTRYTQSLASKHVALEDAWRAFSAAADTATAHELQVLVHRLAGSAPAYGYGPLGPLASAIDGEFTEWENAPADSRASARVIADRLAVPVQALLDRLAAFVAEAASTVP